MRIDPSNRTETQNRLTGANTQGPAARTDAAELAGQASRLETADAVHDSYIRKAAGSPDVDMKAIAEARRLLDAGELDTPQAIARAAENMIAKGI